MTAGAPDATRPPFSYRLRTRVEISDTDLGAVVYYARYPHYLDQGVVAYRRQLDSWFAGRLATDLDYRAEPA